MNNPKHSIKSYCIIAVFALFWLMSFAFVFPTKIFRNKVPKIAWVFDQVCGQKWNFFTQPHLYNDRLIFIVKDTVSNKIIDSTDVLTMLWKNKRQHAPFNTYENVYDHIVFRQTSHLREALFNASEYARQQNNNRPDYINQLLKNDTLNNRIFHNLNAFGKMVLREKGVQLNSHHVYKMMFYTDYMPPFKTSNHDSLVLEFTSDYKPFNEFH